MVTMERMSTTFISKKASPKARSILHTVRSSKISLTATDTAMLTRQPITFIRAGKNRAMTPIMPTTPTVLFTSPA